MSSRLGSSTHIRALAFVLLSGVLAFMVIATLLLLGVKPHLVFTPGFIVMSWCDALGLHVPNRVGVLSTGLLYWGVIAAMWLAVAKMVRRG